MNAFGWVVLTIGVLIAGGFTVDIIEKKIKSLRVSLLNRKDARKRKRVESLVECIRKERPLPDFINYYDWTSCTNASEYRKLFRSPREVQVKLLVEQANRNYESLAKYDKEIGQQKLEKYLQEKRDKGIRYSLKA